MVGAVFASWVVPDKSKNGEYHTKKVGMLKLRPSPLHPACPAHDHIHRWHGVFTAPSPVIDNPIIRHLASLVVQALLKDPSSYGSGLRKFHIFCFNCHCTEVHVSNPGLAHCPELATTTVGSQHSCHPCRNSWDGEHTSSSRPSTPPAAPTHHSSYAAHITRIPQPLRPL